MAPRELAVAGIASRGSPKGNASAPSQRHRLGCGCCGPAAQAGLTEGDVITAINGTTVTTGTQISQALIPLHPGDKLSVTYTDTSGQSHTTTLTLGTGPSA